MRKGSGTINNLQSRVLHNQTSLSTSLEAFPATEFNKILSGMTVLQHIRDIIRRQYRSLKHWKTFTPWCSCLPEKILLNPCVVQATIYCHSSSIILAHYIQLQSPHQLRANCDQEERHGAPSHTYSKNCFIRHLQGRGVARHYNFLDIRMSYQIQKKCGKPELFNVFCAAHVTFHSLSVHMAVHSYTSFLQYMPNA
jgi:hypothetical protein